MRHKLAILLASPTKGYSQKKKLNLDWEHNPDSERLKIWYKIRRMQFKGGEASPSVTVDHPCQTGHVAQWGWSSCIPVCNNAVYNCLSVCNRWAVEGEGGSLVCFSLSPWQKLYGDDEQLAKNCTRSISGNNAVHFYFCFEHYALSRHFIR